MKKQISLTKLLERQKEVFDAYCQNGGCIYGLEELKRKYELEDEVPFSDQKIRNYFSSYIFSSNFSDKDNLRYHQATKTRLLVECSRGKELIEAFIAGHLKSGSIKQFGVKYANDDKKDTPYSLSDLNDWIKSCIKYTKDQKLIKTYQNVAYLIKHSINDEFDVNLINSIIEFKTAKDTPNRRDLAIEYIRSIKISKYSILCLLNIYKSLYPANKKEYKFVYDVIEGAYETKNNSKYAYYNGTKVSNTQNRILNIIEEFLSDDVDYISDELLFKYQMSFYQFREALRDIDKSNNNILKMQVKKYYDKLKSLIEYYQPILKKIEDYIIISNHSSDELDKNFGAYEYCMLFNYPIDKIKFYSIYCLPSSRRYIIDNFIIKELSLLDSNEKLLLEQINDVMIRGNVLNSEEQQQVINYMKDNNLPLCYKMYVLVIKKYLDGQIINNDNNQGLMNKL